MKKHEVSKDLSEEGKLESNSLKIRSLNSEFSQAPTLSRATLKDEAKAKKPSTEEKFRSGLF